MAALLPLESLHRLAGFVYTAVSNPAAFISRTNASASHRASSHPTSNDWQRREVRSSSDLGYSNAAHNTEPVSLKLYIEARSPTFPRMGTTNVSPEIRRETTAVERRYRFTPGSDRRACGCTHMDC